MSSGVRNPSARVATPTNPSSPVAAPLHRVSRRQSLMSSPQQVRKIVAAAAAPVPAPAAVEQKENVNENGAASSDNCLTPQAAAAECAPLTSNNSTSNSGVEYLPKMSVSELKKRLQGGGQGVFVQQQKGAKRV